MDDLARVLDHYALGSLRASKRVERGFVDDNWVVDTDRGRYFVKRRHPRRRQSARLVRAQHALMQWLRLRGFPAPLIMPTAVGETYLVLDEEMYEIEGFIGGKPYDHGRPEHLSAAAMTLGRYHVLVQGFSPEALRERGTLYHPATTRSILAQMHRAWQLDEETEFVQIVRRLQKGLADLADHFAQHGELAHLVIHGDYHGGNLLFDGDRVVGVVDYDKASWQPRVAEMAEALIYFASPRPGHLKRLVYPGFLVKESFARFLHSYAAVALLEEAELRALPDYVWCIWFTMSLQRLLERSAQRPADALEALQEVLALCTWASVTAQQMIGIGRAAMDSRRQEDVHDQSRDL